MAKVALSPYVGGLPFRWLESVTAARTLTKFDSGTIFHTAGATATVAITLPAIADGPFYFRIINGADVDLTVTAATADTIITYNDVAADSVAFSTANEKVGGEIEVLCDGTSLYVLPRFADGRYQTATIVTA
jgi:hypothetical protein